MVCVSWVGIWILSPNNLWLVVISEPVFRFVVFSLSYRYGTVTYRYLVFTVAVAVSREYLFTVAVAVSRQYLFTVAVAVSRHFLYFLLVGSNGGHPLSMS